MGSAKSLRSIANPLSSIAAIVTSTGSAGGASSEAAKLPPAHASSTPPTSTRTTPDPAIVTLPAPSRLACLPSRAATRPILRPLPGIGNSPPALGALKKA
jgi:hypothetical protein